MNILTENKFINEYKTFKRSWLHKKATKKIITHDDDDDDDGIITFDVYIRCIDNFFICDINRSMHINEA